MMDRRIFLTTIAGLLTAPLVAEAQPAGRIPRIGFLANVRSPATEGFEQGLRELGYVEGKNIIIEWRLAQGDLDRLPGFAAELVRLKVDVIVAPVEVYVLAARQATQTIPVVFALVLDPVGSGFVQSLARPGGNITGLTSAIGELYPKRLQLLKEAIPGLSKVALLTTRTEYAPVKASVRAAELAARSLQLQAETFEVRDAGDLERTFSAMTGKGIGAVLEIGVTMFYIERKQIAELAAKHRLPAMFPWREGAEAGGLMSYSASFPGLMRRSATYVDKILKGAKPADLPVEQPTRFELVINLKTAKALGLTIPPLLLMRADQVIE